MKIRCDLHINGGSRKLVLAQDTTETLEHLSLKLAAYILFWDMDPLVSASLKHPSLMDQEFVPDLVAFDDTGTIKLWGECGKVALHKLGKIVRRCSEARIVVLKETEAEARRFRADVAQEIDRSERIEILSWPGAEFKTWRRVLDDRVEAFGDAQGRSLNLVLNEHPFAVDLVSF
ncbi:MAG: YaeQ family protein [Elusimicrobiota bacterium]